MATIPQNPVPAAAGSPISGQPGAQPGPTPESGANPVVQPQRAELTEKEKQAEKNETVEFKPSEVTLEDALKMWRSAKKYVDNGFRDRWDNYFRVYAGERVDPSYFGTIKVNNREAHTIIETLVANIGGGMPTWNFVPTNEEQRRDTDLINNIVGFYMEYNSMNIRNQIWVREMLMYGTGILHVAWREGKAYIENIPVRDFFVDPTSTDIVRTQKPARYAGFEYLAMKDELESTMIFDADKGEMVAKYDLEGIGDTPQTGGDSKEMDKRFKDMFNGSTIEQAVTDQVHVIIIYDLASGKIMEIGNQKKFIYYSDSHLQREEQTKEFEVLVNGEKQKSKKTLSAIKPFLPFAVIKDYMDPSVFYGEGEMSVLMGDSELLNDYEEMDADNTSYQNTPMYGIDPAFSDMAGEIETIAGAVYPLPKGAWYAMDIPQLGEGLRVKKMDIIQRMRGGTAADEAVQGISQGKSRVTATEVDRQLSQAQGRFTTKLTNLASGGYAQLGSIIFKMMQLFLTAQTAIRIIGKDGIRFEEFDPWDWSGEFEPQVELDAQIQQKKLMQDQKNQAIFQAIDSSADVLDPVERARFKFKRIDPEMSDQEFNDMLAKPKPPTPPDPREFIQLDKIYTAAGTPPDIKAQIEAMAGLQPSKMHDAEMQSMLIHQAADNANRLDQTTDSTGKTLPEFMPQTEPAPAAA